MWLAAPVNYDSDEETASSMPDLHDGYSSSEEEDNEVDPSIPLVDTSVDVALDPLINLSVPINDSVHSMIPADALISSELFAFEAMTQMTPEYGTFPIIWDTGASYTITPDRSDFVNYTSDPSVVNMQGFGQGSTEVVCGEGEVLWHIEDSSKRYA